MSTIAFDRGESFHAKPDRQTARRRAPPRIAQLTSTCPDSLWDTLPLPRRERLVATLGVLVGRLLAEMPGRADDEPPHR